ncbi:MAG: LysE family translocator [Rhodospirillaceae bacterium]|nr:LysE family translocator [Rhodospirillaceae bacterium]MCA8932848.1 LysE family translocator [Rhodospirillaceae bacterium]
MIDLTNYLIYIAACVVVVAVPGPTVTVIIANSLRYGTRAGLMNVAGTQLGNFSMIAVLAAGFTAVVETMGQVFDWVRLLGAAYLIYLGIRLWRARGELAEGRAAAGNGSAWKFFVQGFVVIWSNPKALLFFGALIPQFVNPAYTAWPQILLLGLTFTALAAVLDSAYGLAAGRTGLLMAKRNVRIVERIGGTCLIGGGLWIALARR